MCTGQEGADYVPHRLVQASNTAPHLNSADEGQQECLLPLGVHLLDMLDDEVDGGAHAPGRQEGVPVHEVGRQLLHIRGKLHSTASPWHGGPSGLRHVDVDSVTQR